MLRHPVQHQLDMRKRGVAVPAASLRLGQASMETVRRRNRQHSNVTAIFGNLSSGTDCLIRNGALIGDDLLAIRITCCEL